MDQEEYVILVDENDNQTGKEEKLEAHLKGLLHRAFSVFLYRKREGKTEVLLQQRESNKYHCGGLWANTCCSHPRQGETVTEAGKRRLKEEVGIRVETDLSDVGWFKYKAVFDNGLTEHEIDHVLVGPFDEDTISFNTEEVEAVEWISLENLEKKLHQSPHRFTPWFKPALELARKNHFDSP
ncbi:MAG: isopentenyl-diphosphate Delta-isomerase [bacterium]|nr:isopentenyl-diphosphate Delta-isomerase [bacterium]